MRYVFRNGLVKDVNPQSKDLGGVELTFDQGLVIFTNRSDDLKSIKLYDQRDLGNEDHESGGEYRVKPVYEFDLVRGEIVSKVVVEVCGEDIVPAHYILRTYTREVTVQALYDSNVPNALFDMLEDEIDNGNVGETYLEPECHFEMTVEDDRPEDKRPDLVVVKIIGVIVKEPEAETPTDFTTQLPVEETREPQTVS